MLRGVILLPSLTDFEASTIVVRLLDVSLIDAPARVLAQVVFSFSGRRVRSIPFELPMDGVTLGSGRATLNAEIRAAGSVSLQIGDWVTTQALEVRKEDLERGKAWQLPVAQIR